MAPTALPETMKRLILAEPAEDLVKAKIDIEEVPVPKPSSSEVLVKVSAAPINPSDYGKWKSSRPGGAAGSAIGNEGSGVVVATGSAVAAALAGVGVGTTVGFVGLKGGQGTCSEYVCAPLATTFAMPADLPAEDAASFFVNPYTAYAILSESGGQPFVHTAAASSLGQMLVKLCALEGAADRLVNVVRKDDQKATLEALGAKHVVVVKDAKTDTDGVEALAAKIKDLGCTVAFDAVAGAMTGKLLKSLPRGGAVHCYGVLAGDIECVDPVDLMYHKKKLHGLFLPTFLAGGTVPGYRLVAATRKVRAGLGAGGWCATKFVDVSMEDMWATFVDMYSKSGFTDKKLRVRF